MRLAFTLVFLATAASADTGIDIAGSNAREEYVFANGSGTVDWQKITLTPWWSNDDWRVAADIPYVQRDVSASGTILACRWICAPGIVVPVGYQHSDSGIGDSRLRATRSWNYDERITAYVTGELTLPTGNPEPVFGTLSLGGGAVIEDLHPALGGYSLGNDSTDFRLTPGITFANDMFWATAEAGYIWSDAGSIPTEDRPMAYAGVGYTPLDWLELAAEFDYEGEIEEGGETLQQATYTLTLRPARRWAITLSMYELDSETAPDSNWTVGFSAQL